MSESPVGVVVAAGEGSRLGGAMPKAFLDLCGASLLARSAAAMAQVCERLVVAAPRGHVDAARAHLSAAGVRAQVCAGGTTRTESVAAALRACGRLADDTLVGVHDAARPLAPASLIARVFAAVDDGWDAAAPGLPVVDTLKLLDEHRRVVRTVDREGLWTVQTPQVFRWAALERAYRDRTEAATDDLALIERHGGRVRLVPGDAANLKITYPEDLLLAARLLARPAQ